MVGARSPRSDRPCLFLYLVLSCTLGRWLDCFIGAGRGAEVLLIEGRCTELYQVKRSEEGMPDLIAWGSGQEEHKR